MTAFWDCVVLICLILLMSPNPALAYLDPSAGNALIYIAVTLVGVAAYTVKGLFYRLMGKNRHDKKNGEQSDDIAIFSEGKAYWSTFSPIVDALLTKGQPFGYYTMDIEDPALTIRNPLMKSRYIGTGSAAAARLNRVSCRVLLATTPNIGTPGYPIARPPKAAFFTHVFHSSGSVGYYKKYGLDSYDGVCTDGDYNNQAIRYLEEKRHLPPKELVSLGVPCWDIMLKKARDYQRQMRSEEGQDAAHDARNVILLAPSWGEKGFLSCYAPDFIKTLASEFDVILRPHPQSWKFEPELLARVKKALSDCRNIIWDTEIDPSRSLAVSDLMISDTSAVRLDYVVIHKKPAITLEMKEENMSSFDGEELPAEYLDFLERKLFTVVKTSEIGGINAVVKRVLADWDTSGLDEFINANIANLGTAGEHIADYLIEKSKTLSERLESKEGKN